jgi:hypothetical protein
MTNTIIITIIDITALTSSPTQVTLTTRTHPHPHRDIDLTAHAHTYTHTGTLTSPPPSFLRKQDYRMLPLMRRARALR